MVESEFVIGSLRTQVRDLQSLLNYLESREGVGHEEYTYLQCRLREVIGRLKQTERFSVERGGEHRLRAQWLN